MTLNGVTAVILRYFAEVRKYGANYIIVIEVRLALSVIKI